MAEKRNEGTVMDIVETGDGSHTLFHPIVGEHYHSKHGALQESKHVFLQSGLEYLLQQNNLSSIRLLEVGFGTGLNYLITADYCLRHALKLDYIGIERYPLSEEIILKTGNLQYVSKQVADDFLVGYGHSKKHPAEMKHGSLYIDLSDVNDFTIEEPVDLIYYDAFAAVHQPEMWSRETLDHVCSNLKSGGVFVTYAITGNLKRIMKSLDFSIEKAPGAPGKREMLRALKN